MTSISGLFPETHANTRIEIKDRVSDWKEFLTASESYRKQLGKIGRQYPKLRSLTIDYHDVEAFGALGLDLADELVETPNECIRDILAAIISNNLLKLPKAKGTPDINIRFVHLTQKIEIRDIRTTEIGKLIAVEGIIRKLNDVRPRLETGVFRCPNGHTHIIDQGYGLMDIPDRCPTEGCSQRKLELVADLSKFRDVQRARIQETPEGLAGGAQPRTIDIDIQDDICDILNAGDRSVITGVLKTHQRIKAGQRDTTFDIYLDCNSIELPEKDLYEIDISQEEEEQILALAKDPNIHLKIRDSIAPSIFGHENVKEAISLQLFGGIAVDMPDGTRLRGDIHVLLIGDPGIAKSQFLRYVTKVSPRAVFVSGQSTTAAGLTAAAVKDEFGDGKWTVEAGALVMADMGIAAVDELEKLHISGQFALLEAMEQQSITTTKAGMNITLKSRCSLLGAANPEHGRFDPSLSLAEQFKLPPPLVSRFDLILLITDVPEHGFDTKLAEHICDSHEYGQAVAQKKAGKKAGIPSTKHIAPPIDPKLMRQYIAYAKRNVMPRLTPASKKAIVNYYVRVRGLSDTSSKPISITARQMEGLIRLAEASARMRLSDEITEFDAMRAVDVADACLKQIAYDPVTGTYDIDTVVTGMTKDTRDLTVAIEQTIKTMSETGPVDEGDLMKALTTRGYEAHKIDKQLTAMKAAGKLMNPRNGFIRVA